MIYLLDTNICIDHLRKRGTGALRQKLKQINPSTISICSIVVAELLAGCYRANDPKTAFAEVRALVALFKSQPFDDAAAEVSASVNAALASRGTPIGHNDLFIAAIAIAKGLILVTHDTTDSHVCRLLS